MSKPNILLVILDSVRAKNCGLYGHKNKNTPYLSSISNTTTFAQPRSPGIHSIASHASIFSGYHVEEHGITKHESYLDPEENIWNELGSKYGYQTGVFTPNAVISSSSNLTEPFDTQVGPTHPSQFKLFEAGNSPAEIEGEVEPIRYFTQSFSNEYPIKSIINGVYQKIHSPVYYHPKYDSADQYINDFLEWVENSEGPWAACINLMDAHFPYVPRSENNLWSSKKIKQIQEDIASDAPSKVFLQDRPWGELDLLETLYDGCIYQMDSALQRLGSKLKHMGEWNNTLLTITSDHGEGFGERSRISPTIRLVDHSWGIHEVLTHVPLIVKEPDQREGRKIDRPATLTNFPDVVRAAINNDVAFSSFLPEDDTVISSTYRIFPPGEELPVPPEERESYFGPWRAIYQKAENGVRKFATQAGDRKEFYIRDAQTSYQIESGDYSTLSKVFENLRSIDVEIGNTKSREIDGDIKEHLEDLGYVN